MPATETSAAQGGVDEEEPAPAGEADAPASAPRAPARRGPSLGGDFTLAEVEREHVVRVLARTGTLREASRILGIDVTTLWRKRKTWRR